MIRYYVTYKDYNDKFHTKTFRYRKCAENFGAKLIMNDLCEGYVELSTYNIETQEELNSEIYN